MSIKIKKQTLFQYIYIYILLLFNQSNLYQTLLYPHQLMVFSIVIFMMITLLLKYKNKSLNFLWLIYILLFFIIIVRIFKGGIGIAFWCEIAIKIEIVYLAILEDVEYFIDRFVKIVYTLAMISIIFWLLQNIELNIIQKILYHYFTEGRDIIYDSNGTRIIYNHEGYGILFYSYLSAFPNRNVGIFTEPGIFQSVLNTALFCIVVFTRYIYIQKKKLLRIFLVILVAVITSQSTSGYIGLCAILIVIFFKNKNNLYNWKIYITKLVVVGAIVLGIEYIVRGERSLFEIAILSKVFDSSNKFSLIAENSTGIWRFATLSMAIFAMLKYPMGLGVDNWINFMSTNFYSGPGGWPFTLGAILGVIPFLISLYWIFKPLKYFKKDYFAIILFVFLYFNTSIAQTSAFYPVLILVPVYLNIIKRYRK